MRGKSNDETYRSRWGELVALALVGAAGVSVFVYVLAMRLEPIVLALIAVTAIAFIIAAIAIVALVIVILRKKNASENKRK